MPTIYDYHTETGIIPESVEFGIEYNTQLSTSSLTGYIQTIEIPGARWFCRMSYTNLEQDEARSLSAFLAKLRGMSGRFYLPDYSRALPLGNASGIGSVVSTPTADSIEISFSSGFLNIGDYIQIGNDESRELKIITSRSFSGGSTFLYGIEPSLRWSLSSYDGFSVVTELPRSVMMLAEDNLASWSSRSKISLSDFNIDCIEVIIPRNEVIAT